MGDGATSLASGADGLWLAVGASATAHRGGTLTLSTSGTAFPTLDPAVAYCGDNWAILTITNDGLLAYKRVGGPDGTTLVPDLALGAPRRLPRRSHLSLPAAAGDPLLDRASPCAPRTSDARSSDRWC